MTWLMIIMIATSYSSAISNIEFSNQQQCEAAKQQITAKFAKKNYDVDIRCVEK